eukprot:Gb_07114 [translate_table: standard]
MTSSARPTWNPAKGGEEQGGGRIFGPSNKSSSRDLPSHTSLKIRKEGQNTEKELKKRNLRDELRQQERKHGSRWERLVPRLEDADDSGNDVKTDSDDTQSDDEEDDTAALLEELQRIREEREEERKRKA